MLNIKAQNERCKKPNIFAMIVIYAMPNTIVLALSPAALEIGKFYGISSQGAISFITTIAVLGYAVGPVFAPLISIKHGRRGTVLYGIILVLAGILGSFVFMFIFKNYSLMLVMRFISSIGGGMALTGIPAMINDYYDELNARKLFFSLTGIYCLWPGIALIICGILTNQFGWFYSELFLLLYGIVGLFSALILPETMKESFSDSNALKLYISTCFKILKNVEFIGYCLIGSFGGIVIYYFIADAPFILISKLHYSTNAYGYIVMIPYIAAFISLLIGSFNAGKFTFNMSLKVSIATFLIFSIIMLILFSMNNVGIFSFVILSSIIIMIIFMTYSYSFANAVKLTPNRITATSMFIFIAVGISGIVAQIGKSISFGSVTYPIVFLILALIFTFISTMMMRYTKQKYLKKQ